MDCRLKFIITWMSALLSLRITHQAVNVAERGVATVSEELDSNTTSGAPKMAIDGLDSDDLGETCVSILWQDDPWWQLDLAGIYHITTVSVAALNSNTQELNGAEIRIGLRNSASNPRCAVILTTEEQFIYTYDCGGMEGRFVHIVRPGLEKNLTICEVYVYGRVLENVALKGVAFQSSSRYQTSGSASGLIDGKWLDNPSVTSQEPGQWATVDLLVPHQITYIQLVYKGNCFYSKDVQVDNSSCSVVSSGLDCMVTLDCGGVVGRYVTVLHPDTPPPLYQLAVYSTWEQPQNIAYQQPPPKDYCHDCGRDYALVHNELKTWFEARAYCREKYTDLATIHNFQDINRVFDLTESVFNDFWIGLHEDVLTWRWSLADEGYYGEGEAEFRNWDVDEPNNTDSVQHCVGIQDTGKWRDLDCDLPLYFLCFDEDGLPNTTVLVETPMMWAEAQYYCKEHYTDLLSVRNQTENQEIQTLVPDGEVAWIGLSGDPWRWSDGSNSAFRYRWQSPNNSLEEGPNCVHFDHMKWSVRPCDTKSMFLCYYFKEKSMVKISLDDDPSDPVIQEQILRQFSSALKKRGVDGFRIRWRYTQIKEEFLKGKAQCTSLGNCET